MGKCFSKSRKGQDDKDLSLRQFELLRSVGRGAFGKVRVVRKKSDKKLYALKYINKEKCISQKAIRNTIFERNLLVDLNFPLIVNLRYAFQDDENIFMVLDLMLGGDLKYHLQQTGAFPEEAVKIYAAEMVSVIEYLHSRGVVHRDIKPDNLLLDEAGHIHLTDFNVATYLPHDNSPLQSFSGTVTYMAPEVIMRQGYREEVDWWSMGVVLYELLFGKRPFRGRSSKEVAIRIVKSPLHFPTSRDISEECLDFITKLLEKNRFARLGFGANGVKDIKDHPFLRGINWRLVVEKKVDPVFIPDPDRPNFSALYEAEDILMEDKPLKPRRKSQSSKASLSPDEQYILASFHDFDYKLRESSADRQELLRASLAMEREKADERVSFLEGRRSLETDAEASSTDEEEEEKRKREAERRE